MKQIGIAKNHPVETLFLALVEAMEEFHNQYERRSPDYILMPERLENMLYQWHEKNPHVPEVESAPISSRERQENEREGIIQARLVIAGVPVLPSRVMNQVPEDPSMDPEDQMELKLLYEEDWMVVMA